MNPGIYIHVPFCDGKCRYCAFYSVPYDPARAERYVSAVGREMEMSRGVFAGREFDSVYVGGGTPSMLGAGLLSGLLSLVAANFPLAPRREWTLEVNPGSVGRDKLSAMRDAGVNRISIGAQSFDGAVLRQLGRRHTASQIFQTVELVRACGFDNVGLDLIAAIPGVPGGLWRDTIGTALDLQPQHVSVYALTVEEGTDLCEMKKRGAARMPSDREQLDALHAARDMLGAAGYRRYEISNYALAGFECAHNVAAWRGGEYLGFGPAAASHAGNRRWSNAPDLDGYMAGLERGEPPPREVETLPAETLASEMLVFGLRMGEGISTAGIRKAAGVGEAEERRWDEALRRLAGNGLVSFNGGRWTLTDRGKDLADGIGVELMK